MLKYSLLAVFSLLVINTTLCQTSIDHFVYKTESKQDSTDKSVSVTESEYYRISAKDHSSWGYKNKDGDILIPLGKYQFLNPIDELGMILAKKDGKEGYIDITEKALIPFIYDDIGVFSKCVDLAPVIKNGKQGFVNRKGDVIIPLEYDAASYVTYYYEPGAAILRKNGKYGVLGPQNNIIIPFEYDKIKWSDNNEFFIATKGENWVSFSLDGKQMSDYKNYEIVAQTPLGYLPPNSENLPILVKTGENKKIIEDLYSNLKYMNGTKRIKDSIETLGGAQFAYIDKNDNVIVPFGVYDFAKPFGLGRKAIVANESLYGIIDEYGSLVLPLEYDFVEQPSHYSNYADIFVATKGETITILDKNVEIIPIKGIVSYTDHNAALIVSDIYGKKGLVNYRGKQTVPFVYDSLYNFKNGFVAKKEDMYGCISKNNDIIKPFEYKYIYDITGELVYVNLENKVGIYDKKDQIKIPFKYDAIYNAWYNSSDPHHGGYIVIKHGKVGTIDANNNVVIPIIYDGLSGWVEYGPDAHFVKNNGRYGLISHDGKIIIPIEYDYVGLPHGSVIVVRKNDKYGVISWQNKEVLPCLYDMIIEDISFFVFDGNKEEPKLVALQNGVWNYFDIKGKLIRENVPIKEITNNYGYRLNWKEPSNENHDFDLIQVENINWGNNR